MKAILIVVAVLLAVTHLGDTQGDHTIPHSPFREPLVVVCVSVSSLFYLHFFTVCYYDVCVCVSVYSGMKLLGTLGEWLRRFLTNSNDATPELAAAGPLF